MQGHTGVGAGGEGGHDAAAVASVPGNILSIGVWGANTDVGKTLVSAGLARAARRSMVPLLYVKPVQTGQVLDAATVAAAAGQNGRVATWLGAHAAALHGSKGGWSDRGEDGSSGTDGEAAAATLFAWQLAASPHRAVEAEGRPVADAEVVSELAAELSRFSGRCRNRAAGLPDEAGWAAQGLAMVETAGGVASPGPTGTLQCDLLRPFRLPCVLVACAKLGGISATVAAAELLQMRGYDLAAVLVPESSEGNAQFLQRRFGNTVPVHTLPALPGSPGEDAIAARSEPGGAPLDPPLQDWLVRSEPAFGQLLRQLADFHSARQQQLASAAARARSVLWWPFTQHGNISDTGVTVIDSRCGEYFAVAAREPGSEASAVALQPQFDGCASWWTQGLSAELQPEVNLSLAAGAGRYGHVMFPENAHEPALQLAERLLDLVGSGWASRVFFSDNGSTAVEVALKMAFRSFIAATEQGAAEESPPDMLVAALEGSYHGDTLGAMDCSPPSEFNGRRQMPWYSGRGVYLQAPSVGMQGGEWTVADDQLPEGEELQRFTTLDQVFSAARDASPTADAYRARIRARFDEAERSRNARIGACLMEPVLLGAGGMVMLDPLYQRVTVQECRARGIPVIFDEVFAGLWRLGAPSAAQLLGVSPDIACYAKLLTGGTMPLAVTLASERVFQAFDGESKLDALLHGHSYTAHPIGCSVANASLATYSSMRLNPCLASEPQPGQPGTGRLVSLWDSELVQELSRLPRMLRVVALGTVLAAELKPAPGSSSGYSALGAKAVVAQLRRQGVFARPLGNVVYLMVTPTTPPATCRRLLQQLLQALSDAEAASVAADDHVPIP